MASSLTPLHIEERGQKGAPPLVLLHGWGQTLESLKSLAALLESKYHLFLIDLPGFGKSPLPPAIWSSFDYADRLSAFLDTQGLSKAAFVGHSFGGKVAMSMAIRYPERVQALVLLAASGLKRQRSWKQKLRFYGIRGLGKACKAVDRIFRFKLFESHFAPKFASSDWKNAGSMRPILVKSVNEPFAPYVAAIRAPTLLLWGDQDTETPLEMAHRLQKFISGSKLIVFPRKGHHLYQEMGGHLCAHHLHAFLKGAAAPL